MDNLTDLVGPGAQGEGPGALAAAVIPDTNKTGSAHYYVGRERTILTVYLGMVVIPVAVIMNSLMIIAFAKYKKLRITGMYFILNLAVSNLIATTISAPIIISNIVKDDPGSGILENGFPCDLRALLDNTLLCVSAITLAVSSLDRCWAVCRPFSYHKVVTTRRALWVIFGIWSCCLLVCLPPVSFLGWGAYKYSRFSYSCGVGIKSSYPIFFFIVTLFIPVLIATVAYSFILSVAIKSINSMGRMYKSVEQPEFKRNHRTMKSSLRTLALVGIFAVTMLPTLVIAVIMWTMFSFFDDFQPSAKVLQVSKVLHWFTYSGYALNPIIYGLMDKHFRGAYKTFLKCNLYQDEFRRKAQEQVYIEIADERRRSTMITSTTPRWSSSQPFYSFNSASEYSSPNGLQMALTETRRSPNGNYRPGPSPVRIAEHRPALDVPTIGEETSDHEL